MIRRAQRQWIRRILKWKLPSGHLARNEDDYRVHTGLGCRGIRRAVVNGLHCNKVRNSIVIGAVHRLKLKSDLSPVLCLPLQWKFDIWNGKVYMPSSLVSFHVQRSSVTFGFKFNVQDIKQLISPRWTVYVHPRDPRISSAAGAFQRGYGRDATYNHQLRRCWKTEYHAIKLHTGQSTRECWAATILGRTYSEWFQCLHDREN